MSCHSTAANRSVQMLAMKLAGSDRKEVEEAFHAMKASGKGMPAPSQEEWEGHLRAQSRLAGLLVKDPKDRDAVMKRLSEAEQELPDGPSFYANQSLVAECHFRRMQATSPDNSPEDIDRRMMEREQADRAGMGEDRAGSVLFSHREQAEMLADPVSFGLILACGCRPESQCDGDHLWEEDLDDGLDAYESNTERDQNPAGAPTFPAGSSTGDPQGGPASWPSEAQDQMAADLESRGRSGQRPSVWDGKEIPF